MRKIAIASLLALAASMASAADYVSIDVDHVRGLNGASDSTAQYVRAGKAFGDLQLGLQSRTAQVQGGGLLNSLELTAANNKLNVAGITPFVGVGYDNGFNGGAGKSYEYGLVGATYGVKAGPGFALLGAKTRVGSTEDGPRTKQSVAFATYSLPVAKNVSLNFNASRSYQDIKEEAFGLGIGFSF